MSTIYETLAATVHGAPRVQLDHLASLVWRSHAAGQVSDGQAQELAELIQARRAIPVAPVRPGSSARSRAGSRPRNPEHRARRGRWVASGWIPPRLAAGRTFAELAVLSVIASEVASKGRCELALAAIAGIAGLSPSTVKAAIREAVKAGLLSSQVRRVTAFRNDTNVVRVISPEWSSWLRLRRRGGGVKTSPRFEYEGKKGQSKLQFRNGNAQPGAVMRCRFASDSAAKSPGGQPGLSVSQPARLGQ